MGTSNIDAMNFGMLGARENRGCLFHKSESQEVINESYKCWMRTPLFCADGSDYRLG